MLGSGPAIDLQKMPILAKKIIFSDEAHFDLGEYVNKQNCCICSSVYTTIFVLRKDKTNYLSNQTRAKCYQSLVEKNNV